MPRMASSASPTADSPPMSPSDDGTSPHSAGGPSSVSGGGGPGSKSKRPRPYASKTCSECRRRKIACLVSDQDPEKCRRCFKMQLHCTLPEEEERGDKRKKSSAGSATTASAAGGGGGGGSARRQSRVAKAEGGGSGTADSSMDSPTRDTVASTSSLPSSSSRAAAAGPSSAKKLKTEAGSTPPTASSSSSRLDRGQTEEQPDTDFIYSLKDEKDRLRPPRLTTGGRPTTSAAGGGGQQRRIVGAPRRQADANRKIAVQFSMQVHGCPIWIYSDLMARFDLLSDLSVPPPLPLHASARMNGCDLSARLTDLQGETVKQIDDVLEDTRLMIPHVPLLRTVLGQQAQRYNSGRLLLIALLLYIATSGADPSHPLVSSNGAALKPIIDDVRLWIQREALNCVLFSPVKSRELVIAIELLAVYDPLLSQGPLHHLETPSFILPTSFYLDAAIGRASRSHIEASIKSLQDWYVQDTAAASSSSASSSMTPLPDHIIEALMDASMWVSLEVTSGEVNRNVKGMTNCFAKDYVSMWPGATSSDSSSTTSTHLSPSPSPSPPPSFSTITTHLLTRLPPSTVSLGARLGLVNLAFRHSGLFLIQETLRELYDGIPDVAKMDRLYTSMEEGLTKRCREFSGVCKERVVNAATSTSTATNTTATTTKKRSDSSAAGGKDDSSASAASALLQSALIDLANDTLEREATWMRHFYGGYCFAILLWLPQLRKAPAQAARKRKGGIGGSGLGAVGSGASGSGAGAAAGAAKGGEGATASAANPSMAGIAAAAAGGAATGGEDEGSATPVEVAPRFHEHGVHDSDIAKSVIDVIRDRNTNPDTIMADAAVAVAGSPASAAATAAGGAAAGPSSSGGAGEGVPAGVASRAGAHLNPTTSSSNAPASSSMSPFDFLVKHTPAHEAGVIHLLTLTLATHSRSRSSDPRRAVTNSRLLYACKEIIENHATRRRGWGKVGEEAAMHVGLLRRVCEAFAKKGGGGGGGKGAVGSGGNVLDLSLAKLVRVLERVLDGWRRTPLGGQAQAQGAQAAGGQAAAAAQGKGGAQRGAAAAATAGGEQSRAQQRHAQQEAGAQQGRGGGQPGPQSGSPAYPSHLMPSSADLQRQLAYGAANAQKPQRSPYYPGGPGGPSPPRLYAQQYPNDQYGQQQGPHPGHMPPPPPPPPPHYYGQHPHEQQQQQQYPSSAGMSYQQHQGGPGGPRGSMSAHPAYGDAGQYGQQQQQHQHQGYGSPMGYRGNEPGNGNGNGYGASSASGYPQPPFGSAQMQQGYGQHPQQQQQHQQQQSGGSEPFPSSSSPLAPLSLLDLDLLSDRNLDTFNNSTNSTSSTFPNIGTSGSAPGSDAGGGVGNHSADASLSSLVDFDVDNLWQSFGGPSTTLSVGMMMEDFMGGSGGGASGGQAASFAQQMGGQGQGGASGGGGAGGGGFEGLVSGTNGGGGGDFSQFMAAAGGGGQTPQQQQQQQQAFAGGAGGAQGQGNGGGGWPQHQPAAPLSAGLGDFDWATMSELFQP